MIVPVDAVDSGNDATLKTLVLTDLVDSMRLVERLGDARALKVFRQHDRLARDLAARHGGLEVDKTDGFFLLFDRPIDAVRYALAYGEALSSLRVDFEIRLVARIGIHLGEVFLHENRAEDIARGAKPLEVDGLAKPMTARVMALARGGQILVTRGAFDLARRAALSGSELPSGLRWLAHGPYLFQGLDEPVEIFEIGIEGRSPLSAPPDTAKSRRVLGEETILGWRPAVGQHVPHRSGWTLEAKLGEGGFGDIWLATHDKTDDHRVFKFCYQTEHLRALRREVTILRLLREALGEREDIARILNWNFDEAPYFLETEHTEGGTLSEWAAEQGGLAEIPLPVRLELAAQVADALSAAHSIGVLHKDVKPTNVLISTDRDGHPSVRLSDFGIGELTKETSDATIELLAPITGTSTGSSLYRAPELLIGRPATTQSDIYALGVLTYQLSIGDFSRVPAAGWERDIEDSLLREDIARMIDGVPNRRLAHATDAAERLRGLETRRAERAAAVESRRNDQRSAVQRRRNRQRLRLAIATAALLALFATLMVVLALRVSKEAERANREAETSRTVSDFLVDIFALADPMQMPSETLTAREVLDRGAERVENGLVDQPAVRARVMVTIGAVYNRLGLYDRAAELLPTGVTLLRDHLEPTDPSLIEPLIDLATLYRWQSRFTDSETLFAEALAIIEQQPDLPPELGARVWRERGVIHWYLGDYAGSTASFENVMTLLDQPLTHPDRLAAFQSIGRLAAETGAFEQAENTLRQVIELRRQAAGDDHADLAWSYNTLGVIYRLWGRYDESEDYLLRAERIWTPALGRDHPRLAWSDRHLADVERVRGRFTSAAERLDEAGAHATDPYLRLQVQVARGELALDRGQLDDAETLLADARAQWATTFGDPHPQLARIDIALARTLIRRGKLDEAEPVIDRILPPSVVYEVGAASARGELYRVSGRLVDAERTLRKAVDRAESGLATEHVELSMALGELASTLVAVDRGREAEPLYRRALAIQSRVMTDDHPLRVATRRALSALTSEN